MTFTRLARPLYAYGLALLFTFLLSTGQSAYGQKIGFGPKLGANVSFFRGDMEIEGMRGMHFGYTVGGYVNIKSPKNKKWQFEANLLYTTRGNNAEFYNYIVFPSTDVRTKLKYNLGYIEVPLVFKYMLNKGGTTRPFLSFGLTYGGLIFANLERDGRDINAFDYIKRDDFGINLGWGITSFFIDRWYTLDIRYYHALTNLSDNICNDLNPFHNNQQTINDYYNSTLSITLAVGLERSETFFLR